MVGLAKRPAARAPQKGTTTFCGRERLAKLSTGSAGQGIAAFEWNPGMKDTFSVGHMLAQSFEKYHVASTGNSLEYVSSSPATRSGRVYMFANYDPAEPPPTTEDEFADRTDCVSGPIWDGLVLHLKGSKMTQSGDKPVRTAVTGQDRNITDGCVIVIGIFGDSELGEAAADAGTVFINYNATLLVQRPLPVAGPQPRTLTLMKPSGDLAIGGNTPVSNLVKVFNGLRLATGSFGATLKPGVYKVSAELGLDMNAVSGVLDMSVFLNVTVDDVPLTGSNQAIVVGSTRTESAMISSNHNIVVVGTNDTATLGLVLAASGTGAAFVKGNRSRFLIEAV